jgi:hypothetical protein
MEAEKHPGGRPPHEPTKASRNLAKISSAIGKNQETIVAMIGISVDTLVKHYDYELQFGKDNVDCAVAGKLVSAATTQEHTGPSIAAAIWYSKAQMGWRPPSDELRSITVISPNGIETGIRARDVIVGRLAAISARLTARKDEDQDQNDGAIDGRTACASVGT